MRNLTHLNGTPFATIFRRSAVESRIAIESWESSAPPKPALTDLPGSHGAIQSTPKKEPRKVTIRGIIGGLSKADDEPIRIIKRLFKLGRSASDLITLGFTDNNFPGAGPHWTLDCMVSDDVIFQQSRNLWRWQVILTAADPHFRGRSFAYTLSEGYVASGRTFSYAHPFRYSGACYVDTMSVFLEGSAESPLSAIIRGPCVNPRILNITTGEYLQIDRTLSSSDEITVDEDNIVKLNGQYKNSLKALGTKLPELIPGVNRILFDDDTSPLLDGITAECQLSYTTRDS